MCADTITTNFSWVKPEPHASPLDWGVKLNADLDLIDAKVYALDNGYNAKNQFILNKATVAAGNPIYGQSNSVGRWAIEVGNADAETGSNNGSNYSIYRYNDAGTFIDAPLTIYRANGNAVFTGQIISNKEIFATEKVSVYSATQANLNLCDAAGAGKGQVYWRASDDTVVLQQSSGGAYVQVGATFCTINKPTTVTGAFTATSTIGCKGSVSITAASGSDNAYTGFYNSAGTRKGYVGWLVSGDAVTFARDGGTSIQVAATAVTATAPTLFVNSSSTISNVILQTSGTNRAAFAYNLSTGQAYIGELVGGGALIIDVNTVFTYNGNGQAFKAGGGSWLAASDARIKSVLNDYDGGLSDILQLRPVVYRYKGNDGDAHKQAAAENKTFIGLVAQEAELAMPELVSMHRGVIDGVEVDDLRSLDSTAIIFALINSVKELKAEIEELKKR